MSSYKQPCRYCDKLVPPDSQACPFCGKVNPLGPLRCPVCRNPTDKSWSRCNHCGQDLYVNCPSCGASTFLGDYCQVCEARLVVICPNPECRKEQPPIGNDCVKCGQPLKKPDL